MEEYLQKAAYDLSLGQKQRVTIAGVLSVKPKYIVMDEPTAMLDPEGKENIIKIVKELKEKGYTIIYITNIIDEVFISNRTIMLENGNIIKDFETKDILDNIDFLIEKGITVPKAIKTMKKLSSKGINVELSDLV